MYREITGEELLSAELRRKYIASLPEDWNRVGRINIIARLVLYILAAGLCVGLVCGLRWLLGGA